MFNSIREMRRKDAEGLYNLTIEVSEKDFFEIYEDTDNNTADTLIRQYLANIQDDARFENVKIHHNKNRHTIRITTDLHYLGNEHTDYTQRLR